MVIILYFTEHAEQKKTNTADKIANKVFHKTEKPMMLTTKF